MIKKKVIGCLEIKPISNKEMHYCSNDHEFKKLATNSLYIIGRPAGYLCKPCMKEWIEIWENI